MPVAQSQELIEVSILVTLKMEFSSILQTGNATHSSTIFILFLLQLQLHVHSNAIP